MQRRFIEYYTKVYGEGAAFVAAGIEVMTQSVNAAVKSPIIPPFARELRSLDASKALKEERPAYFKKYGDFVSTKVYDFLALEPGNTVKGPGIIEAPTTTFVIPPDQTGVVNKYGQLVVEFI
jgi:N-methylhydantoinase A/oxoprolinase/acetone carboxylase beta subunit